MPPQKREWSTIETQPGVLITGGYLAKPYAMETKVIEDIDENNQTIQYTFARLNKGQDWLFKAVAGADACRRDLFHLNLLEDIEKAVMETSAPSDESQEAITAQPPVKKIKSKRARDSITRVKMPRHPPHCAAHAGDVEIRVYNQGSKGQWIDVANIPWLVDYLRREREHTGCDEPDTAVADETEIQGVSIRWNWESHVWIASLSDTVRMPKSLPPQFSTCPKELTPEKWAKGAHLQRLTVDFEAATPGQRREAARCYLLDYVTTVLN